MISHLRERILLYCKIRIICPSLMYRHFIMLKSIYSFKLKRKLVEERRKMRRKMFGFKVVILQSQLAKVNPFGVKNLRMNSDQTELILDVVSFRWLILEKIQTDRNCLVKIFGKVVGGAAKYLKYNGTYSS